MPQIAVDTIKAQIASVLTAWGMPAGHVATTADLMVEADIRGIDSHGIGMLPQYHDRRKDGRIIVPGDIRVVEDLPAMTFIDAGHALGHVPAKMAMQSAIAKAKDMGVAVAVVRNSNHFGAAGVYSTMALDAGLIGICMTGTSQRSIVPPRAREPMFSTNPIAMAAPAQRNPAFSLDMATSTVAVGKLNIYRRAGKAMPVGWALKEDGSSETDGEAAFYATPKRMTPLGGTEDGGSHKGYGLAIMVDILCSVLSGSYFGGRDLATGEPGDFINVGSFFLAIDPMFFRGEPGAFEADMDALIDQMHGIAPLDPAQPVLVAGEPEEAARALRLAEGVPMTDTLYGEVRRVAEESGVPFLFG
ncbi:MAG: Ldh family oxidoreductase [Alphaproteobacteria bacterium]|nr:Ldh family oxidoreductase [Alphaproteobacteria bacterium]MCB9931339.1 Ldh family oxidoreductase [Alphaproteobacteria bacterium]